MVRLKLSSLFAVMGITTFFACQKQNTRSNLLISPETADLYEDDLQFLRQLSEGAPRKVQVISPDDIVDGDAYKAFNWLDDKTLENPEARQILLKAKERLLLLLLQDGHNSPRGRFLTPQEFQQAQEEGFEEFRIFLETTARKALNGEMSVIPGPESVFNQNDTIPRKILIVPAKLISPEDAIRHLGGIKDLSYIDLDKIEGTSHGWTFFELAHEMSHIAENRKWSLYDQGKSITDLWDDAWSENNSDVHGAQNFSQAQQAGIVSSENIALSADRLRALGTFLFAGNTYTIDKIDDLHPYTSLLLDASQKNMRTDYGKNDTKTAVVLAAYINTYADALAGYLFYKDVQNGLIDPPEGTFTNQVKKLSAEDIPTYIRDLCVIGRQIRGNFDKTPNSPLNNNYNYHWAAMDYIAKNNVMNPFANQLSSQDQTIAESLISDYLQTVDAIGTDKFKDSNLKQRAAQEFNNHLPALTMAMLIKNNGINIDSKGDLSFSNAHNVFHIQ